MDTARPRAPKDELGRWGEDLATRHLAEDGLTVLDRNWRCQDGEIDVIARDPDRLVFCEVKTRSSEEFGTPAEAVTPAKKARVRALARRWLDEHEVRAPELRLDVISVLAPPGGPVQLEHLCESL
ncbi:MAG: YraN family protein [Mycobacteriales bacterium]